jgi:hypothetical protein
MANDSKPATAGKECVWDYPRPPRLEPTPKQIRVEFAGVVLADSRSAFRVLETSHPPVYYIPPKDVAMQYLVKSPGRTRSPGSTPIRRRPSIRSATTLRSTRAPWMAASSAASGSCHSRETSTVAGSPRTSWVLSKAEPEPVAGSDASAVGERPPVSGAPERHACIGRGLQCRNCRAGVQPRRFLG